MTVRYVVMALYPDVGVSRNWVPVVVGNVVRRPWRGHDYVNIRGRALETWCEAGQVRDPHIEEVAANDPLLLGPFNRVYPCGVQHYPTVVAAKRNLDRLLVFAAKQTGLRSSATEQPLRKRQVEGLSPSGGSKWIRRQNYQIALKALRGSTPAGHEEGK